MGQGSIWQVCRALSWLRLGSTLCVCGLCVGVVAMPGGLGSCSGSMDLSKDVGCNEREAKDCKAKFGVGARVRDIDNCGRDLELGGYGRGVWLGASLVMAQVQVWCMDATMGEMEEVHHFM